MRKLRLCVLLSLCMLSFGINTKAQTKKEVEPLVRCATETAIEQNFRENPALREEYNLKNASTNRGAATNGTSRITALTGPVTIPVIVHVVLPNPSIVTEEQIDYLLNRLNLDFSGLNPDSANATLFYPIRGHSLIRFTRARRTPSGQFTNGIERRVGNVLIAGTTYQAIKHTSTGGLDPWDVTQYYNIWVGQSGNLLGIAPAIGVGGQTETTTSAVGIDGVCVNAVGFSNGCFSDPFYALGRTAVHEIGHNFGLYHTFTGCATGADFAQPTPPNQTLPVNLVGATGDDTPSHSTPTSGVCPTGILASNCAGVANPPGINYQNYMDYTNDPCLTMFTKNQVERMHYMLETYRPGYLTTQGAVPPVGFPALDAGLTSVISPGGSEFNNSSCTLTPYPVPTCAGQIVPRVSVTNFGSSTITSITATVTIGTTTSAPITFNVNLLTNRTASLVFPAQTLVTGANNITFTITAVNGVADTYTSNNTLSTTVTVANPTNLPFTQNFSTASATAFPPANMTIANPNNNNTWVYNAAGNGNVGSAFINNFSSNTPGQTDDMRTLPLQPPANPTAQDSIIISFDIAHKNYPNSPETFSVLVSTNCGTTFTTVFTKSGATLATAGSSTTNYTTPAAGDWRRERIALGGAYLTSGPIIVAFRNTNNWGNNIFLDNINVSRKVDRDLAVTAINTPAATICSGNFTPQVVVTNNGGAAITSFNVGYRVGTGAVVNQAVTQTINPNATAVITLAPVANLAPGTYNFTAFTSTPANSTGTGDQEPANDTLTKAVTVATIFNLPVVEGFEGTAFPPANWTLINPNNNNTWVRDNHGRNSSFSAKIDNYNFNLVGQIDALQTPALRTTGTDSVIIAFDVAHKNYVGANDSLKVLISTDCGNTFTTVYARGGAGLATAGSSANDYTAPIANDWRRDRISIPSLGFSSGNVIVRFQAVNGYGNNIFLDNINVSAVYRRDAQLLAINQPGVTVCTNNFTPSVTVRNAGIDTLRGVKIGYVLDNGTAVQTTLTNLSIASGATQVFTLAAATTTQGSHTFKAYTFDPVTTAGTGDPNPANDTLTKVFYVVSTQSAPLAENFEGSTFPPAGWGLNNADGALTWQRTTIAARRVGRTDSASAFMNNYNYSNGGTRDELYTPRVTFSGVDSLALSFDVAAVTYSYPGSTEIPLDTLEVLVTTDCGTTFTSVYKKWGNELQTVSDPNTPNTSEFIPSGVGQWRREQITLPAFVNSSPIQVVFRSTNNYENNIYIDNVNLNTKTLPAQLKEQGYLIYPTPFTTSFTIQHYLSPSELRGVAVYNSFGQRVWAQTYVAGGATSTMQIDMSRYASGMYTVVLQYTNRTVSQKIIKAR